MSKYNDIEKKYNRVSIKNHKEHTEHTEILKKYFAVYPVPNIGISQQFLFNYLNGNTWLLQIAKHTLLLGLDFSLICYFCSNRPVVAHVSLNGIKTNT
jgi:hypothetical protein